MGRDHEYHERNQKIPKKSTVNYRNQQQLLVKQLQILRAECKRNKTIQEEELAPPGDSLDDRDTVAANSGGRGGGGGGGRGGRGTYVLTLKITIP